MAEMIRNLSKQYATVVFLYDAVLSEHCRQSSTLSPLERYLVVLLCSCKPYAKRPFR